MKAPEPDPTRSSILYRSPRVRSLFTTGWDLAFESTEDIWVTVELSDQYRAVGMASGKKIDGTAAIGCVHVNPPGLPLKLAIRGSYRAVQFAVPVVAAAAFAEQDHELDGSRVHFVPVLGEQDWHLARLLYRAASRPAAGDEQGLMREVVSHLLAHYSSASPIAICRRRAGIAPARMRRVVDFVEAHLDALTVDSMAAVAGSSPFHFAREFKRTTGETPWSYVTSRRLARAMKLLGEDVPLEHVASAVGFADASHLTHRMRIRMGCSPTEARRFLLV